MITQEQQAHFFKGGVFSGVYSPEIRDDLSPEWEQVLDKRVIFCANMDLSPIWYEGYNSVTGECGGSFNGDLRVNLYKDGTPSKHWTPMQEFSEVEIVDEFVEESYFWNKGVEKFYMYDVELQNIEQFNRLFGEVSTNIKFPFIAGRAFEREDDDYWKIITGVSEVKRRKRSWSITEPLETLKDDSTWTVLV